LGNLEVKKREERVCVHPATGKRVLVPPKLIIKFKTSSVLKEKLKELKS
jgi:nucleoid DNA-binding protein